MENSALNKAHLQSRKADSHLRAHRFEEAAECHRLAADLLAEAMHDTKQPRALESLRLQRQHHLRQTDVIKIRKAQYEKFQKAVENHKTKVRLIPGNHEFPSANLHVAIFRTMEEADSLMDQLLHRGYDSCDGDAEVITPPPVEPTVVKGSKQPKDDKQVVEELRTLNKHLHNFVVQLMTQLDESKHENESLKKQVRLLTSQLEATQPSSSPSSQQAVATTTATPSSAPLTSPYVISPCADLSPDITPTTSRPSSYHAIDRALPILAPLEMPQFDYSAFPHFDAGKSPPPDITPQ